MGKITSKNNDLLRDSRQKTSPKIYNLLLDLVNGLLYYSVRYKLINNLLKSCT